MTKKEDIKPVQVVKTTYNQKMNEDNDHFFEDLDFQVERDKQYAISSVPSRIEDQQSSATVNKKDTWHVKDNVSLVSPQISRQWHISNDDKLRIRLIEKQNVPELFIEFDILRLNTSTNHYYWVEKSRWLKFEEDYNPDTQRFDSPHLSPISIRGITDFRTLFSKCETVLDCHHEKFINVLNNISDSIIKAGKFTPKEMTDIRNALVLKHYHAGEVLQRTKSDESMYIFDNENQCYQPQIDSNGKKLVNTDSYQRNVNQVKLDRKLKIGTEALSVQVAALESLGHTFTLFVRLNPPIMADGLNEVNCPLRFIFILFGPKSREEELTEVGRVFSVMMSNIQFLEVGYSAKSKQDFLDATKVFVTHSVVVPLNKVITQDSLAAMMPQMKHYLNVFLFEQNQRLIEEIKKEMSSKDKGINPNDTEFRNRMSTNSRISEFGVPMSKESNILAIATKIDAGKSRRQNIVYQLFPPFRYFIDDWKGMRTRYLSDYSDAFTHQNAPIVFIGIVFVYFVVMAPAITFGALLNAVNPMMTVTMMFLACGSFQLFYALFGGQPAEIVGITGTIFAVEKVLGTLANTLMIELVVMRFWIGIYVAVLGFIFVTFNGVIIIKHIRRSVEEIYNTLISAIYILSALFGMLKALPTKMTAPWPNGSNIGEIVVERQKFGIGGATLFLAFFMTNMCLFLVEVKKGSFFRRQIRNLLGSLSVPLGITMVVVMERIFFHSYSLPTLNVPPSYVVNFTMWFHVPLLSSLMMISPQVHAMCFAISISLFSILTCEVSTNAIVSTKSERKLLKPTLYSINFFYILVLFPLISAILGWPFVSGASIRTHAHCSAMSIWSVNLPGMPPRVIGSVEQRISGIFVGALVLLSVFLGSVLQYIPMAAMFGMFLYMGVTGAVDLIFVRRIVAMLQRRKYWAAHDYLKDYPTWNIMTLVAIQLLFVGILIVLNCISEFTTTSWTPLLFPVIILMFGFVRGYLLPLWPRLNTHLSKVIVLFTPIRLSNVL